MLRTTGAVAATALILAALPAISAASDTATPVAERPGRPKVTLTVPSNVVEGDRFTVEVKVAQTDGAKVVQLEQQVLVHDNVTWQTVGKSKARSKKKYQFQAAGGELDTAMFRAKVSYREGKPAKSAPTGAIVWHWLKLGAFEPYANTSGVNDSGISPFTLNGLSVYGWFTTGSFKSWESRFTLGRHCQAIRGIAGVRDESADGSSAVVRLLADDVPVYTSPSLTPGTSQPFQVALALPFRLTIQAQNTSSASRTAYPALGAPELLCTGLG